MQIKLISENQVTEEQEEQVFTLPVAIGRDITQLPAVVNGETVSPVVLLDSSKQISRLHAQISLENNQLYLEDKSANGTELNGKNVLKERHLLNSGDRLRIGNYTITVLLIQAGDPDATLVLVRPQGVDTSIKPMQIKLISENQVTEEQEEQVFTLPVAIGRDITQLPAVVNGETVSPVVLLDSSKQISRLHAQISLENNQLYLEDKSANGTELNGKNVLKERHLLNSGDRLRIGNYTITVLLIQAGDPDATLVLVRPQGVDTSIKPMQIKLISENQVTEEQEEQVFTLPVAIGRDITQLPAVVNGETVSPVVLLDSSKQISRLHAQISLENNQLYLEDKSANGTELNGKNVLKERHLLNSGDRLRIGNYTITVLLIQAGDPDATVVFESTSTIFNPQSEVISASSVHSSASTQSSITFNTYTGILEQQTAASSEPSGFPYSLNFWHEQRVSLGAIKGSGYLVKETEYVACGGGMGSFVWVDMLRIAGVKRDDIKVLSIQDKPYKRYESLLRNCQIPRYKRIRSGSDSCPDNIWGWPGYALRDAWRGVFSGQVSAALGFLWQVFAEPIHADTYTPRAKDVFESMDREGDRISWNKMLEHGSIRSLRQTEDGRYCIAYCASPQDEKNPQFLIAKYVHLCTGYPGIKLLPDLEKYRQEHPEETGDEKTVVQGYEPHDHIYQQLEKKGGTIFLRGSGIVASQVLDRLYAAQKIKPSIKVIHLNREPRKGNQFDLAKRHVENDWEFQPFNWPKGTWGGDMRTMLEEANPLRRRELLQGWGGTTTASRKEWRDIIQQGKKQQWYEIRYGLVTKLERNPQGGVVTHLVTNKGQQTVPADFVIDCTGLVSDPLESPFLKDLIEHYDLDLNPEGRFHVENNFEIKKVRNDRSRVYAAGIITLGGPYAPVDTFLGLQYAAHRSVEALAAVKAPGIRYIQGFYSLGQWLKWALNIKP